MGLIPRSGQSISNWLEIKRCSTFPTRPWPPPRSKQAANAKKSVSLSQRLICWAHCDALNQSLDGTAGRLLKRDFWWIFRRQNANPAIGLWLSPQIKAEDHKYWEIYDYAAFVDNAVLSTYSELCKEVRSLWTTPYHKERHARIHKHAQRLSFFFQLAGRSTTCKAVMACTQARGSDAKQGLFEMLIMGRKGRGERRGASSL